MNNKGITKFWIEIIGGVIIVVIILVIILVAVSSTSKFIEDAAAVNSFQIFVQTMSKATTSGTQVISPWTLSMGRDNSVYAIVYMTQDLVSNITSRSDIDTKSKFTLSKCEGDLRDTCLCMLSIKYREVPGFLSSITCDDLPFNLIAVDSAPTHDAEKTNIVNWNNRFPLDTMEHIEVLECSLIKPICKWTNNAGVTWPCLLHYQGKPVVWISAQGGPTNLLNYIGPLNPFNKLDFETLEMDKDYSNFYIEMKPQLSVGLLTDRLCASMNCDPCFSCSQLCSNTVSGYGCKSDFTGLNCIITVGAHIA
jgi:hypothetical protein